jgi:hypothetical protein
MLLLEFSGLWKPFIGFYFLLTTFALVLFLFFFFYLYTTTKFYLNLCSKRETVALSLPRSEPVHCMHVSREKEMCRTAAHASCKPSHVGTSQPKSCADSNRSLGFGVRTHARLAPWPVHFASRPRGEHEEALFNASYLPCLLTCAQTAAPSLFGVSSVN